MKLAFDPIMRLSNLSMANAGRLQGLATWIIDNRDRVADMGLAEVARAAGVSETTVFRLARKLGFSGFRDLRMALTEIRGIARGQTLGEESGQGAVSADGGAFMAIARNTIYVHKSILQATLDLIDPDKLERAINAISEASVIHLIGFGSSAAPTTDLYQRLVRFGFVASQYSDPHILASVTAMSREGSLFLAISYSGQSRDVVEALSSASEQGNSSILITSNPDSAAGQYADIVLNAAPSGSLIGSETVATRVSQLAIIDMICTGLALNHPRKSEFIRNSELLEKAIEKKRVAPLDPPRKH